MITVHLREKKRKRGTSLYLDINNNGARFWEPLDFNIGNNDLPNLVTEKLSLAEQIRATRLLSLISGQYEIQPAHLNKDFLTYYKKQVDKNPKLERRATLYKHLTDYCKKENIKKLMFGDINTDFWEGLKSYLKDSAHHAPTTIHTEFVIFKSILNKAIQENIILKNPLRFVKFKKPKTIKTYLTWGELDMLYRTPCAFPVVKNAFFFSCYTGIRLSDVKTLKKKYFWPDKIALPSMEKTDDSLLVDYNEYLLKEYIPNFNKLSPEDFVFNLPANSTTNICLRQWAASAGIVKKISYHTSRHTFATGLITYNNGNLKAAQVLLGHKDSKTTEVYAKLIDEERKRAINSLPKLKKTSRRSDTSADNKTF